MTYSNDPHIQHNPNAMQPAPNSGRDTDAGSAFTPMTWASLAFILLLFGGVALWAYQSGDVENAAVNRPGIERTTTGQGNASSKAPAAKAPAAMPPEAKAPAATPSPAPTANDAAK